MKQCKYCGKEIEDSMTSCPSCSGMSFSQKCNHCGTVYDGAFCPNCGLKAGGMPQKCPRCGKEYQSNACPNCGFISTPVNTEITDNPPKKKYTWLWVLGWIFVFPVPLTILMLRNKKLNKSLRIGIIVAAWAVFLLIGIVANSSDDSSETERKTPSDDVELTFSSYDVEGQLYQDIVTRFKSIGLDNIELVPIEDLITGWLTKDGEIEKVTINGNDYFHNGEKVKKDALIRISYHTFPAKETTAETVPAPDIVTEEITASVTEAVTEKYTEMVTERITESVTSYTDNMVKQYISAALGLKFQSNQYVVKIDNSMVVIQFTPAGISSLAYRASELGEESAFSEWNKLVATATQWSKDLSNVVHDDMNRPDLKVALFYCHDLNPDNVVLVVMNGDVYYDFVNGINLLS